VTGDAEGFAILADDDAVTVPTQIKQRINRRALLRKWRRADAIRQGKNMDESRLDRIERILAEAAAITRETANINRETANITRQNAAHIAAVSKAQDDSFVAMKQMIEAQELLLKTLDWLAKLWGRSPN
jgi:hypothetical protein